MMLNEKMGPMKLPEKAPSTPVAAKEGESRVDVDFDQLLSTSNAAKSEELAKEKAAAGGNMQIGENKSDKDFREMLEKVTGKKQDKLKNKLEKDDYLNLMVTQLKYQDPTKPMDNQEMATQLASFNTVEQLMGVNKTLQEMKGQANGTQMDKLTPLLGKMVDVKGNKIQLREGKVETEASFRIPSLATSVNVQIKDPRGEVVRTLSMGSLEMGEHRVKFDGKDDKGLNLPAGQYTFQVNAAGGDGKALEATSQMKVMVQGITDIASGGKLDTSGGAIELAEIVSVRSPESLDPKLENPKTEIPKTEVPKTEVPKTEVPASIQEALKNAVNKQVPNKPVPNKPPQEAAVNLG
jgi:flagellar basal-body rod modification protein FlgD